MKGLDKSHCESTMKDNMRYGNKINNIYITDYIFKYHINFWDMHYHIYSFEYISLVRVSLLGNLISN